MNHLVSYPFVAERYEKVLIKLPGWYYDIGTGIVYDYNFGDKRFERIE